MSLFAIVILVFFLFPLQSFERDIKVKELFSSFINSIWWFWKKSHFRWRERKKFCFFFGLNSVKGKFFFVIFHSVFTQARARFAFASWFSFFFTSQKAAGHGVRERMRVWGGECARVSECWEWVTVNVFFFESATLSSFDCASRKMSVATHRFVFKGKSFANFLKFFSSSFGKPI